MRSTLFVVVLLLLGCVMSLASPALPPTPAAAASSSPNSASSFQVSEYQVDADGLWSDHEIPLSDASIEAIRHATPATPEDIAAWNAEVEPDMQVQAVDEDDVESDVESENEPIRDELEIAHGEEGRMLLIPHSRHFMMRRFIMFLTRLISKIKAHSSLARITLKLKVEPITPTPTPTPTPLPTRIRIRRPPPSLGIPYRPGSRPVAIRLIPSQSSLQTRRILTRCSMLLRQAVQRLHHMRQIMMKERMKERGLGMPGPNPWQIRGLRFPGRGVILFRSNNITATGPTYTSTTTNRLEIEGEKNGTVTIIAPRVNATLSHAVIVINRGTLILLNRSRNNTFAFSLPSRSEKDDSRRRFPLFPIPSHHIMNENVDEPHHEA